MKNKLFLILSVLFLGLFNTVYSKIIWFLPFQIMMDDFYNKYLTFQSGSIVFALVVSWFLFSGFKVAYLELKKGEQYNFIKKSIMLPFIPFIK